MSIPPNPDYGNGVFRRRILLRNQPALVLADVEDCFHAFRVRLGHDGRKVTHIESEAIRYPVTYCTESTAVLRSFVGTPLSDDRRELREHQIPGLHCTHQYDLVWLAMAQALRGTAQRQYDIDVPDERDGCNEVRVYRDGRPVLCWQLRAKVITGPTQIAGKSPFAEFGRWASAAYTGELLEAAYVAQACTFVSGARRVNFAAAAGTPTDAGTLKPGTCYTYQPERIGKGLRTGSMTRDFTDSPELLLKFV